MGLTSALNTSLNGLSLNETTIDVLGNNVANAATAAFKSSGVRFQTQLSRTLSIGSRPNEANGGTNPRQIGLGAQVASISKDFSQGPIVQSTSPSDLAIQGNGFFVVNGTAGVAYTRNGGFKLNSESQLVNDTGAFVQGYGVDENFQLDTTSLQNIQIPLTQLQIAQVTKEVKLGGALQPTGDLGTSGSIVRTGALFDNTAATPTAITATTLLTSVSDSATGTSFFAAGTTVEFTPSRGGREIEPREFSVTATTTVQDYLTFIKGALGIQSTGVPAQTVDLDGLSGTAPAAAQPDITLSATGQILILGNAGTVNDILINGGDIKRDDGTTVALTFTKTDDAVGQSVTTDFVVYDSLGQPVNLRVSSVLESRTPQLSYRYLIESDDTSNGDIAVANGTIAFDTDGRVVGDPRAQINFVRAGTGASTPLQIEIDFSQISGITPANSGSRLNLASQDGSPPGTLQSFVIDETGVVNGIFDNGLIRTLGQVVLARFANNDGLVEDSATTFKAGVSSGTAVLVTPGSFGAGSIRSGALEQSNADIGRNLVDLIVASTNYRGNARVISSVQNLVDELLQLGGR